MRTVSKESREQVFQRYGGQCVFVYEDGHRCSRKFPKDIVDYAHILNRGQWPALIDDPRNAVVLCRRHHELTEKNKKYEVWLRSFLPGEILRNLHDIRSVAGIKKAAYRVPPSRAEYHRQVARFKETHGGLSPSQFRYKQAKQLRRYNEENQQG